MLYCKDFVVDLMGKNTLVNLPLKSQNVFQEDKLFCWRTFCLTEAENVTMKGNHHLLDGGGIIFNMLT